MDDPIGGHVGNLIDSPTRVYRALGTALGDAWPDRRSPFWLCRGRRRGLHHFGLGGGVHAANGRSSLPGLQSVPFGGPSAGQPCARLRAGRRAALRLPP
jgi:hypothetical protein